MTKKHSSLNSRNVWEYKKHQVGIFFLFAEDLSLFKNGKINVPLFFSTEKKTLSSVLKTYNCHESCKCVFYFLNMKKDEN